MGKKRLLLLLVWWLIGLFSVALAQHVITGRVVNNKTSNPIAFAALTVGNCGTITNKLGYYKLEIGDLQKTEIYISALGFKSDTVTIKGNSTAYEIRLSPSTLELAEITVSAQERATSLTAHSHITQAAIQHLHASSLADALSLVPGIELKTRDKTTAQLGYLRTPVSSTEKNLTSAGVGLYIDGIPISNNANLQISNSTQYGAGGLFETTSSLGNDLRQFSTYNIASIDIIRGIASAKYSDITSGVIDVKREVGLKPLTIMAQYDPDSKVAYVGKGIAIGKQHILNTDLNFRNNISDIRLPVPSYNQVSSRLTHNYFAKNNRWQNALSADFGYSYDIDKKDANDAFLEKRTSEEKSMRLNTKGHIVLSQSNNQKLSYVLSWQLKHQNSQQTTLSKSKNSFLATAQTDSIYESVFLPSTYYSDMTVDGKPQTMHYSLVYNNRVTTSNSQHILTIGTQYRHEKNHGNGRMYNTADGYYANNNQRNRSYKSIPAISQLSLYIEDAFQYSIGNSLIRLNIGFRYDNFTPKSLFKGKFGHVLQPRINLGYDINNSWTVFAGYGVSAQQAPLVFLYPDKAYLDVASFSYFSSQYPDENRVIVTTKVIDTQNKEMTYSEMKKVEFGGQFKRPVLQFNYSLFNEEQSNMPSYSTIITPFSYDSYDIGYHLEGKGQKPKVDYINVDQVISRQKYLHPTNKKKLHRKGFDFSLQTEALKKLTGTQVLLTCALFNTQITDNNLQFDNDTKNLEENTNELIGIYKTSGIETDYFLTKLTFIQHIPQLRFIASITLQNRWINKFKYTQIATIPEGYLDKYGDIVWFQSTEDIPQDQHFLIKDYTNFSTNKVSTPTNTNVSLRLTKEISDKATFSFFINNLLLHNPAWINERNQNIQKGNEALYFSGEIKIKL